MIKNLIFVFKNKTNITSNFYNHLTQLNLKLIFVKFIPIFTHIHFKQIIVNDQVHKINQFLKLITKCNTIFNVFSYKKNIKIFNIFFFQNKKIKFFKNFMFVIKYKNFIFIINNKKHKYFKSILNNFLFYKFIYI